MRALKTYLYLVVKNKKKKHFREYVVNFDFLVFARLFFSLLSRRIVRALWNKKKKSISRTRAWKNYIDIANRNNIETFAEISNDNNVREGINQRTAK